MSLGSIIGSGYAVLTTETLSTDDARRKLTYEPKKSQGFTVQVSDAFLTSLAAPECANLVRPFIKVHVVNKHTGRYLQESNPNEKSSGDKALKVSKPYLPKRTSVVRLKDNIKPPRWENEVLVLDAEYSEIVNTDTLILFEVLDEKPSLKSMKSNSDDSMMREFKSVCWSYLYPFGENLNNLRAYKSEYKGYNRVGVQKAWNFQESKESEKENQNPLQTPEEVMNRLVLYTFQDESIWCSLQRYHYGSAAVKEVKDGIVSGLGVDCAFWAYDRSDSNIDRIPEVYFQWRRAEYSPIQYLNCNLCVTLGTCVIEKDIGSPERRRSSSVTSAASPISSALKAPLVSLTGENMSAGNKKIRNAVLKRTRGAKEPCIVPNQILGRVHGLAAGATLSVFANCGSVLAVCRPSQGVNPVPMSSSVGGTYQSAETNSYDLLLIDSDTCTSEMSVLQWAPNAHHGIIYQCVWSKRDDVLVTCSSDGICKVWDVSSAISLLTSRRNRDAEKDEPYTPELLSHISLVHSPPVFIYSCAILELEGSVRIFTGGHDGNIRQWDGNKCIGKLSVSGGKDSADLLGPHGDGRVTALVIEESSRFLISGDSNGLVLIWKSDTSGTYHVLRKLRTELCSQPLSAVTTLRVVPASYAISASGSTLLVISPPNTCVLFSLTTYKPITNFPGLIGASSLLHQGIASPDGRLVCAPIHTESGYRLRFWEVLNGTIITTGSLSQLTFPNPIYSIAWHPTQHVVAIATGGDSGTLSMFYAEKEASTGAVRRLSSLTTSALQLSVLSHVTKKVEDDTKSDIGSVRSGTSVATGKTLDSKAQGKDPVVRSERINNILARIKESKQAS